MWFCYFLKGAFPFLHLLNDGPGNILQHYILGIVIQPFPSLIFLSFSL